MITSMITNHINITIKFADSETFKLTVHPHNDNILQIVKQGICLKCKLSILPDQLPLENLISRFKIVFKGKVIQDYTVKISSLEDINNDTILHCIFPNLSQNEINNIYKNISTSDIDIDKFLSSEKLRTILKDPTKFTTITNYINNLEQTQNDQSSSSDIQNESKIIKVNESVNISNINVIVDLNQLYEVQINDLQCIGFESNEEIIKLLDKYKGNVQQVINELLG